MEITFTDPNNMYFLLGVPLLIVAYIYNVRYKRKASLKFSNFEAMYRVFKPARIFTYNLLAFSVSMAIFICLVLAASGSTIWYSGRSSQVDFVVAIDSSASMTADDFNPNRLVAAKEAANGFVGSLPRNAKVAVISFSGTSFLEQEITSDFERAKQSIDSIEMRDVAGTDIGNAVITSANLLISGSRPKVIVLLTDGRSTVGIPLEVAQDYAKAQHIMAYTIGIGTAEGGKFAGSDVISTIDEESLKSLAESTGAKYYAARNKEELKNAYSEIASEREQYVGIRLGPLLLSVIILLLMLQWVLSFTKYNSLP